MKIVVISDIHGNKTAMNKVLKFVKKNNIGVIIDCGDTLDFDYLPLALANFFGKYYLAKGNADLWHLKTQNSNLKSKIQIFERYGEIKIGGKKIGFVHNKKNIPNTIIHNSKYIIPDLIFYGHTHKPWIEKINDAILVNPGAISELTGTFVLYDTKTNKLELKIISKLEKEI